MASPRRLIVDPAVSGTYHCVSRCVRRAFLCGRDSYTGNDYEHRRAWIRDQLGRLTGLFAIEVQAYAVMSNHLHVVLRTLPELLDGWTDEEIARRWLELCPGKLGQVGHAELPGDARELAIRALCRDPERLEVCRRRLGDLSWFMRFLNEPIARRANREDGCTGRFWEGRFRCQKLDDAGAALACMIYVDLNPVRAGIAPTPEESEFTSARDRATAHRARKRLSRAPENPSPQQAGLIAEARVESESDCWLAPIAPPEQDRGIRAPGMHAWHGATQSSSCQTANQVLTEDAAPVLLQMSVDRYLELLEWTGRQIRTGKRGRISRELCPILERLDLDVESWVENVETYGSLFRRFVGKLKRFTDVAEEAGRAWLHGRDGARRLYGGAA